jgi:D-alanine-D-alanine ligase
MQPVNVLLLFGGESAEHEVSIASARNVHKALVDTHCNTTLCYIDKTGKWWLVEAIADVMDTNGCSQLVPQLGEKTFLTVPGGTSVTPDVIFPVLHGPNGEDGSVQGVAQLLHVPIVGPGILGAAATMDKEVTKMLLQGAGLPVVDWITYRVGQQVPSFELISNKLGNPVFVKPATLGSSVGVTKVYFEDDLQAALDTALKYDNKVLIERAVEGRELEVAVMGNYTPEATKAGEIKFEAEFYSYEAKYAQNSQAKVIVPAELPDNAHEKLRKLAVLAYQAASCRGMARVDFFLDKTGKAYINEINSLPGFTNISMFPKLWQYEGVPYTDLVQKLISYAKETIKE